MPRPDDPVEEDGSPEAADDGGDDSAEEDDSQEGVASDSASSDGPQSAGAAGKKKKKKKKPKKKKNGLENGQEAAAPSAPKADKAENDRRFNAALAAIKADELWVDAASSNLQDGKVKKLLEQLPKNESLTSLNLSQNSLTDEGAQAIAATLGMSSCVPGLITLDLRENNFTDEGLTILDGLKKVRRNLTIMTGAIVIPVEPAPSANKSAAGGDKRLRDLSDSPLVRKYFQIGEEEDDTNMPAASDPSIDPADLWQQLDGAVSQGTSGIPAQQGLLKQLCQKLSSELGSIADGEYAQNVNRCPHVKACLERLSTLGAILELTPENVTVQYHRQPQAAVGSHRVFAAEAVATLVCSQSLAIDQQLAAAKLVPRVLHLAISHPVCSAVHARALKLLRAGLGSKAEDLMGPVMVLPGWGLQLQEPVDSGAEAGTLCQPFPSFLASRGTAALGVVSGSRHALMGFIIEASKLLSASVQSAWDPDSDEEPDEELDPASVDPLKRILDANATWSEYAQSRSGPLSKLGKEQEGDLGGPRAVRVLNHLEGPELAELAGGGMITGQEILALLQGMNMS